MVSVNAWADEERENMPHVLYVETNDHHPGKNSILAYRINERDGRLTLMGAFPTRGTGADFQHAGEFQREQRL